MTSDDWTSVKGCVCCLQVSGNDRSFQDIMKCYRMQPQAQSHVYRSVLLNTRRRSHSPDSDKTPGSGSNSPTASDENSTCSQYVTYHPHLSVYKLTAFDPVPSLNVVDYCWWQRDRSVWQPFVQAALCLCLRPVASRLLPHASPRPSGRAPALPSKSGETSSSSTMPSSCCAWRNSHSDSQNQSLLR